MTMKEGKREWGNSTEKKAAGRLGRKRWRGNLTRKFKLIRLGREAE